jgi:hypothetical protein
MTRENWQKALAEVEEGVRACLTALDRYEATFDGLLTPAAVPSPTSAPANWDASLARVGEEVNRVELLLAEQQAAWGRWHAALDRWEQSLETKKT